jgi:hypothetical protein
VDEGIVECGEDVADTENVLSLLASTSGRRSVVDHLLFFSTFFAFSASLGTTLLLLSLRLHTKRDERKQRVWLPYYLRMRDIE